MQAVVSVSGSPLTPEPAAEQGFKIERSYHTLDGEKADPSKAKQNQRFVVVLKMTEPQPQFGRVIVADYLPAGFEIDNPRLVSSGETGTLAGSPMRQSRSPANSATTGSLRLSSARRIRRRYSPSPTWFALCRQDSYVLPQAKVEDMYRPDRFGRTATGAIEITAK